MATFHTLFHNRRSRLWAVFALSSLVLLQSANSDARQGAAARDGLARLAPGLPATSAWALPPGALEKPRLLLEPAEREAQLRQRKGPLRTVGQVSRAPASAHARSPENAFFGAAGEPIR
jgi:hypothetical protein